MEEKRVCNHCGGAVMVDHAECSRFVGKPMDVRIYWDSLDVSGKCPHCERKYHLVGRSQGQKTTIAAA